MRLIDQHSDKWMPEPNTGCYIWMGWLGGRSMRRPRVRVDGKPRYVVDVFSAEAKGPCPPGKERSHKCDTQECINPDHIVYETHAENMARDRGTGKFHP